VLGIPLAVRTFCPGRKRDQPKSFPTKEEVDEPHSRGGDVNLFQILPVPGGLVLSPRLRPMMEMPVKAARALREGRQTDLCAMAVARDTHPHKYSRQPNRRFVEGLPIA
jgi:hypothetical protein